MIESIWPHLSVKELIRRDWLLIGDGYRVRRVELGSVGTPFIRGGDIGDGWISTDVEDHVLPEYEHRLGPKFSQPLDVAFITKGSVGRVGLLRPGQPRVAFAPQVCFWRSLSPGDLNPRFLFYLLGSRWFQTQLDGVKTSGSMVADYVSLTDQQHFRLPVPPEADQRRIAEILGAFDDKIELNRKMNRTLEAMAQALFKSWFVDFDGHDDLVDSELGPIPRGWRVGALREIASLRKDMVDPAEVPHDAPYWGLADMPRGSIALDRWGTAADAASRKATCLAGDVLFGKLRPYFKKVGVTPCDGICSSDILVIKAKKSLWTGFLLGVLTFDSFIDLVSAAATGTRMPRANWKTISSLPIVLPATPPAESFDRFVKVVIEKIHANIWQNRTLAEIRDALLPKLISGEIRVPEAERMAEAVA